MTPARRYDLDWIRIAAFGTLILYHVGMFYVTWDWHVKSSRASDAIEPLMQFFSPWRLMLLFLISGVATRFIADKMSFAGFARARIVRLIPPLLFAMFVIVPPQAYYEIVEALVQSPTPAPGALDNFYVRYATGTGAWCDADDCLTTPTYNHMWFVAYLIFYTLILFALMPLLRRAPKALGVLLKGLGFFLLPWLFLWITRITMFPVFGQTHDIFDDPYLHTIYLAGFLFGFAVAKHDAFFQSCMKARWFALAATIAAWMAVQGFYAANPDVDVVALPDWQMWPLRGVRELQAWSAVVAAFGFAHRYLKHANGPVRRYFTQGIFPFYILHQTIIVVAGHHLDDLGLPLVVEAPALVGCTLLGCWLGFEIARRLSWLRPWFGISSLAADSRGKSIELPARGTI